MRSVDGKYIAGWSRMYCGPKLKLHSKARRGEVYGVPRKHEESVGKRCVNKAPTFTDTTHQKYMGTSRRGEAPLLHGTMPQANSTRERGE